MTPQILHLTPIISPKSPVKAGVFRRSFQPLAAGKLDLKTRAAALWMLAAYMFGVAMSMIALAKTGS